MQDSEVNAESDLLLEDKRIILFDDWKCSKDKQVAENVFSWVKEVERGHSCVVDLIAFELKSQGSVCVVEVSHKLIQSPH